MTSIERDAAIIRELGGPSKVAVLLNLNKRGGVQRVQNWTSRGIPASVKVRRPELFMPELVARQAPRAEAEGVGELPTQEPSAAGVA